MTNHTNEPRHTRYTEDPGADTSAQDYLNDQGGHTNEAGELEQKVIMYLRDQAFNDAVTPIKKKIAGNWLLQRDFVLINKLVAKHTPLLLQLIEAERAAAYGWKLELPNLPYFQVTCFDNHGKRWESHIYETKNAPVVLQAPLKQEKGKS